MSRKNEDRLLDILDAIGSIRTYISGMAYDSFLNDRKSRDAVVRNIEIIGEAVRSLSPSFLKSHPQVAWKDIIGIRNIIVHHYFGVMTDIVWNVIQNDLPVLEKQICEMLGSE
jgi:uncharacterized protein with HEPN domain